MVMAEKRRMFDLSDDAGMTIVEIMISAVIFFIVLTAILGLVGVTTTMGVAAKEKTVMTNAINSYVERVQAMNFEKVLTDGSEGSLSVETTTVGEFTVTITPTVRPYVTDEGEVASLKFLDVTIDLVSTRGQSISTSTTVTIRDRSELMSQAVSNPETDPTIKWGSMTPPENAVVWDHNWTLGELYMDVDATAKDGRLVEAVSIYVNDRLVKNNMVPAQEAFWLPHAETFSSGMSFVWNTEQTFTETRPDGTEVETPLVPDGICTLTAWVADTENVRVSTARHFLVDNYAPPKPGVPIPEVKSASDTLVSWPEVYDGVTPTDHYILQLFRYSSPAEWAAQPGVAWRRLPDQYPQTPYDTVSSTPLTIYWAWVASASPRFTSAYTSVTWWWVSRPLISGTNTVKKSVNWTTSSTLSCTKPNFPTTTVTYVWERIDAAGNVTTLPGNTSTITDVVTAPGDTPVPPVYSYRCTVKYSMWYSYKLEPLITSNTVGPTGTVAGTVAFTEGTW